MVVHKYNDRETVCTSCGRKVLFVDIKKVDGTPGSVPLDPAPAVYSISEDFMSGQLCGERIHSAMVSHFVTCPNASTHSKKKKKTKKGAP